ncbi:MAG: hypothetical protein HUU20_00415 [Pirellulales bacterium]|nr:hypothetical protein [Pirellulales bacterium]
MDTLVLAVLGIEDLWFAVPLIITVSLVYAATRHEFMGEILGHALRIGVWIVGFMAAVFAVLQVIAWFV